MMSCQLSCKPVISDVRSLIISDTTTQSTDVTKGEIAAETSTIACRRRAWKLGLSLVRSTDVNVVCVSDPVHRSVRASIGCSLVHWLATPAMVDAIEW